MYQKILVPLDGSGFSECILEHVKAIATGCRVPDVVLLRVIEPLSSQIYDVPEDWRREAQKRAVAEAKSYVARVSDSLKRQGVATEAAVIIGDPAEVILDYVKKNSVDLVMMSTKGQSGITRWTLGSVTDKVVRQCTVPVLVTSPPGCVPGKSRR